MFLTHREASPWQLGGQTTPPDHPVNFPEELPFEDGIPVWKDLPKQIIAHQHDRRQIPSTPEPPHNPLHNRSHGILRVVIVVLVVGAVSASLVGLWLYIRWRNRKRGEGYPGWQLHRGMVGQSRGNGLGGDGTVGGGEGTGGERVPAVVEAFAPVRVPGPAQAQPVTQAFAVEHYAPAARGSAASQAPPVVATRPLPKVSYG